MTRASIVLIAILAPAAFAAPAVVDVSGTISAVSLTPRGGPATITVKADDNRQWKVLLGSIRYLIDNDFNPKAGQKVSLSGMTGGDHELIATVITLPEKKQTLRFRDEEGRPLWRGGMHGKGARRSPPASEQTPAGPRR